MFGVLYYLTLSLYRVDKVERFLIPFIVFAALNALYTSTWDIVMDWSLCNPYAKHPMLREVLVFRKVWIYYIAMILDIAIRFNWIFYAIFTHDVQHSAVLSFFVSFSEVCRRGMWTIFRVENEHCTNIYLSRASRDLPLPYSIPSPEQIQEEEAQEAGVPLENRPEARYAASANLEQAEPRPSAEERRAPHGSMARRLSRVVATAHALDFQRKAKPADTHRSGDHHDDDDDDDEEEEDY